MFDKFEYLDAIKSYDKAISLDGNNYIAFHNRGLTYDKIQKYDQAIKDFSRAIEINPNSPENYLRRAMSYRSLNKNKLADIDEEKYKKLKGIDYLP